MASAEESRQPLFFSLKIQNFPEWQGESVLRELVAPYKPTSTVLALRKTRRPDAAQTVFYSDYGYAVFDDAENFKRAIKGLNGMTVGGKMLAAKGAVRQLGFTFRGKHEISWDQIEELEKMVAKLPPGTAAVGFRLHSPCAYLKYLNTDGQEIGNEDSSLRSPILPCISPGPPLSDYLATLIETNLPNVRRQLFAQRSDLHHAPWVVRCGDVDGVLHGVVVVAEQPPWSRTEPEPGTIIARMDYTHTWVAVRGK